MSDAPEFLLVKRGLYYRPGNQGHTGIRDRAGRYHASDATPESGIEAVHESDAPMFSSACWEDIKVQYLTAMVDHRNAVLRGIVELIGNVDHSKGHGPNAAQMRGEMLNAIREAAATNLPQENINVG